MGQPMAHWNTRGADRSLGRRRPTLSARKAWEGQLFSFGYSHRQRIACGRWDRRYAGTLEVFGAKTLPDEPGFAHSELRRTAEASWLDAPARVYCRHSDGIAPGLAPRRPAAGVSRHERPGAWGRCIPGP